MATLVLHVVRQGMDKSDEYWRCFPPFLWLLRDVLYDMPERHGKQLTPTEFLTREVLSMKVAVRETLTQCFPTFECKTLPPPSTDKKLMAKVSTNLEKLDSLFNQGVDELISFVKANMKAKKLFDAAGTKCDGPTFATFVDEVTKAVNDPHAIPTLDSTWKLVVESRCRSVQERLLSEYCNIIKYRYDEVSKGGPIEEVADNELEHKQSLMEIHDNIWSELGIKLYNELGPLLTLKATGECTLERLMNQLEKQLIQTKWETDPYTQVRRVQKVVGGKLFPIAEENRKRSSQFCEQLFTELYTPIIERVQMTVGEDGYTPDSLATDMEALLQEYVAKSVGPEKWRVYAAMVTIIKQNKELFQKHLHEMIQYAKKERETKEMCENLQNENQALKESKKQIEVKLDDITKQQQEAEKRRRQEVETEVKELKEKLKEQEQKNKEMNAKEIIRRMEDGQRLAEESLLRERAEEKLNEMEQMWKRNKEEESMRSARADEEMQTWKQKIEEDKLKEATRYKKSEQEIDDLKAQIKEWEQKLKQKEQEQDKQKAQAYIKIQEMEQILRQKAQKEVEEEVKHEKKLRQKAEEFHEQWLIIERMKKERSHLLHEMEGLCKERSYLSHKVETLSEEMKRLNEEIVDIERRNPFRCFFRRVRT